MNLSVSKKVNQYWIILMDVESKLIMHGMNCSCIVNCPIVELITFHFFIKTSKLFIKYLINVAFIFMEVKI